MTKNKYYYQTGKYQSPEIEVMNISAEQGFCSSSASTRINDWQYEEDDEMIFLQW